MPFSWQSPWQLAKEPMPIPPCTYVYTGMCMYTDVSVCHICMQHVSFVYEYIFRINAVSMAWAQH